MATQYYASVNDMDTLSADVAHAGTSGTAGDVVELRMGDGTYVPTQRQVLNALDIFRRWIMQDGLASVDAGSDLPPSRG